MSNALSRQILSMATGLAMAALAASPAAAQSADARQRTIRCDSIVAATIEVLQTGRHADRILSLKLIDVMTEKNGGIVVDKVARMGPRQQVHETRQFAEAGFVRCEVTSLHAAGRIEWSVKFDPSVGYVRGFKWKTFASRDTERMAPRGTPAPESPRPRAAPERQEPSTTPRSDNDRSRACQRYPSLCTSDAS